MFRPKLLFTSLAALALGACSPQDPQAVTSAAIAKQVILPTYSRWVEADRTLAASALAYCEGKTWTTPAPTSSTRRKPGPNCNRCWSARWPKATAPGRCSSGRTRKPGRPPGRATGQWRQAGRCRALGKASVVVRGLSAYEYILFDSKPDIATAEQKARYCPLLVAIGEHQKVLAEEILKSWNSTDGMLAQMTKFPNQRYADSHEAIADLLRAQVTAWTP
jgi:predicted lipoprotein